MNKLVLSIVCAGLTVGAAISAHAIMYTGSLTWADGGLVASDGWADNSTVFSWTVQSVGTSGGYVIWQYTYNFTVPTKGISHFIIEVSPDFSANDLLNVDGPTGTMWELGQFAPGPGNPNMPDNITGISFGKDPDFGTSVTISFTTLRAPVWGDFYAKGGTDGKGQDKIWVTAWNAGFTNPDTDPDPLVYPPRDGSVLNHILRPDTVVKGPDGGATVALLGLAVLGLGIVSRKLSNS